MPLINLQTNLKSLKFGNDRPGGGSSNQPYIRQDIPIGDLPAKSGPDFLLRNGFLAPIDAVKDVSRLTQMFFDLKSPNGLLFIAKENLLSRTAVKTEASKGPGYGGGNVNAGIYTPLGTLLTAAGGFAGSHLNLLGLDPTTPQAGTPTLLPIGAGLNRYEDVVRISNNNGENRLLKILNNTDPVNILTYSGGPGAALGVGETNIKYASGERTNTVKTRRTRSETTQRTVESFVSSSGASSIYSTRTGTELSDSFTTDAGYTNELNLGEVGTGNGNSTTNENLTPATKVADKTYQTVRPSGKTTGSWVDPVVEGASKKFEEFGGEGLTNTISPDGGNTWDNTSAQTTTKPNSLEINPNLPGTERPNGKTTDDFIDPIIAGASKKFEDYGGVGLVNTLSKDGGNTWDNTSAQSGTKPNSLEVNSNLPEPNRPNSRTESDFVSPLGVSNPDLPTSYNSLTGRSIKNNISKDGGFTWDPAFDNKATKGPYANQKLNSQLPKPIVKSLQTLSGTQQGGVRINYQNATSETTKIILDSGVTLENNGVPYYAKTTKGSFFGKEENTQLTEVASIPVSVVTSGSNLEGGVTINYEGVIGGRGVSSLWNRFAESNGLGIFSTLDTDYQNKYGFSVNYFGTFNPTPLRKANNSATYTMEQIASENLNGSNNVGSPILSDFRDKARNSNIIAAPYIMGSYIDYNAKKKDTRLKMGSPGKRKTVYNYTAGQGMIDRVNGSGVIDGAPNFTQYPDLVNFSISIIDNASTQQKLKTMHFRAFIDSFNDGYSSDWGSIQYVGRADKFYNYKGFDRKISMGFTVYAQSREEMQGMYEKLNYLASSQAPSYANGGFMKGNMARITLGNYINNQLGIIKGFTYDVPNDFSWEIGIDENGDGGDTQLPMGIKVSGLDFVPIQEFVPSIGGGDYIAQNIG